MATVLSSSRETTSYFSLRRSHSAPKFSSKQTTFRTSSSASQIADIYDQQVTVFSDSLPSSVPPSSPTLATEPAGLSSSPKTAQRLPLNPAFEPLQLDPDHTEDQFALPQYGGDATFYSHPIAEDLEPPLSPRELDGSYTVSPCDNNTSTGTSRPDTPDLCFEHADDDTAVRSHPSRHVDYLSHDWKEEDIWESWKYIVSRKREYNNAARLENASWRTWMKSKNNLQTVSAEKLNW